MKLLALLLLFISSTVMASAQIQGAGIKTCAQLTGLGLSCSLLPKASQIWDATNNQLLSASIVAGMPETVVAGGTCSTSYTINPANGTMINLSLNGACAISVTNLHAGNSFMILLKQLATTAPTLSSAFKFPQGTPPTFSTSATTYGDLLSCASLDGVNLMCGALINEH